jgi:zinc transport system substrate-binding protein
MLDVKKGLLLFLSMIIALGAAACGQQTAPGQTAPEQTGAAADAAPKLAVYTSLYPLQYVAERIGGEFADVKNVVPAGVEPHDFEPTAKDLVAISASDIFIYNGSGFESWVEKAAESFDKSKMIVVNATEGLPLLKAEEHHEEHHEEHEGDGSATDAAAESHEHDHGEFDPHVWLDPTLLKAQAEKVKQAFIQADQAHSADYEKNYQALATDLDKLDQEYKEMVAQSSRKEFMVSHTAFSYLAHKYGLEQIAISGISPEDEPSPSELKELVEHVKEHNINYVLFETLASPKVAEVIARETGAQTARVNPLEGLTEEEAKAGKDYLSIMRENLETLRTVLK